MTDIKKKLLLHVCCGPCSAYVAPETGKDYNVAGFFYNPNIDCAEEYEKRLNEARKVAECSGFTLIAPHYEPQDWIEAVRGLENEPEGGDRCRKCFYLRLFETALMAKKKGFDLFCTTMTVAPMKNAALINEIGLSVQQATGVSYLPSDFKKKDGYRKTVELSKKMGLYRQNYCGCIYSRRK